MSSIRRSNLKERLQGEEKERRELHRRTPSAGSREFKIHNSTGANASHLSHTSQISGGVNTSNANKDNKASSHAGTFFPERERKVSLTMANIKRNYRQGNMGQFHSNKQHDSWGSSIIERKIKDMLVGTNFEKLDKTGQSHKRVRPSGNSILNRIFD